MKTCYDKATFDASTHGGETWMKHDFQYVGPQGIASITGMKNLVSQENLKKKKCVLGNFSLSIQGRFY